MVRDKILKIIEEQIDFMWKRGYMAFLFATLGAAGAMILLAKSKSVVPVGALRGCEEGIKSLQEQLNDEKVSSYQCYV